MSIKTGRKQHNRKRIRLVAVVGLSVIAAVVSVVQGFQRSQVYARENQAFQGIGRIVKEHNTQEDPFVILDIVPGQAEVAWSDRKGSLHNYEFSLATMGYLVSGQTPIEEDLLRIFGQDVPLFYDYKERLSLAQEVMAPALQPTGPQETEYLKIGYEETYESVPDAAGEGWHKLYDSAPVTLPGEEHLYTIQNPGDGDAKSYRIVFGVSKDARAGYRVVDSREAGSVSVSTSMYRLENGCYVYSGRLMDLKPAENGTEYDYREEQVDPEDPSVYLNPSKQTKGEENQSQEPEKSEEEDRDKTDQKEDAEKDTGKDEESDEGEDTGKDKDTGEGEDTRENENDSGEDAQKDEDTGEGKDAGEKEDKGEGEDTNADSTQTNKDSNTDTEQMDENSNAGTAQGSTGNVDSEWKRYAAQTPEKGSNYYALRFEYVELTEDDPPETLYQIESAFEIGDNEGNIIPWDQYYRTDAAGGIIAETIGAQNTPVYIRCAKENDWLRKYVFSTLQNGDNENCQDFAVKVVVKKAGEVSVQDVNEADLVYLEDGAGEFLNPSPANGTVITRHYIDGQLLGDITQEAAYQLLYRAVADSLAVIVDSDILDMDQFKELHYGQLARVFAKKDLAAYFYEDMDSDAENLFLNLDKDLCTDNNYHYVNQNVYMMRGTLAADDFMKDFSEQEKEAGFEAVRTAISMESMTLPGEDSLSGVISRAKAIQYILNYASGMTGTFRDIRVLELQPTTNKTADLRFEYSSDGKSVHLVFDREDQKKPGVQLLSTRTGEDTASCQREVTLKSVAEFNCEREELNESYNMVFIGLDGQRLYKDEKGNPKYNNTELNGLVYHSGDRAAGLDETYDYSDLSEQGKESLLSYLRAGYPVVVEDAFFRDRTAKDVTVDDINDKVVGKDTRMYDLLRTVINDGSLRERHNLYTVSDVRGNAYFYAQLNVRHLRIEYAEPIDMVQTLKPEEGGGDTGTIPYKLTDSYGEEYPGEVRLRFYIDWDGDGVFQEKELVPSDKYTDENRIIHVRMEGLGEGVLGWKLEAVDTGNEQRRSSIQGYFRCGGETAQIRVLQITGDGVLSEEQNLEKMCSGKNNLLLGDALREAEEIQNVEYVIRTLSAGQVQKKLETEPGFLRQWDVLLLGMGNPDDLGGLADAVNAYAAEGRAVLVLPSGARGNRMGLDGALLGQSDARTYTAIGEESSELYRYQGLSDNLFGDVPQLEANMLNEGLICYYPFTLKKDFALSESNRAGQYLMNPDADFQTDGSRNTPCTTVWYTLGSSLGENRDSAYSISEKDGRNNYLVYSKGNIVYLGIGSYPYTKDSSGEPSQDTPGLEECHLFVNALMTAYYAGVHNPEVSIVAGFAADNAEIESITIPFDQDAKELGDEQQGIMEEYADVYFCYRDSNMALLRMSGFHFYYEDPDGEAVLETSYGPVKVTEFTSQIFKVQDNQLTEVAGTELKEGEIYRIKAPVAVLRQQGEMDTADIYIVLHTSFEKNGTGYEMMGLDRVSLNRATLFPLE
jgi:hypothetical protein